MTKKTRIRPRGRRTKRMRCLALVFLGSAHADMVRIERFNRAPESIEELASRLNARDRRTLGMDTITVDEVRRGILVFPDLKTRTLE
jgi:hypothetical protein